MGSMNLLGFSLSTQEHHHQTGEDHSQTAPSRFGFNHDGISGADVTGECFDLTSHHDSTAHSLNLPPFGIYEAFHRNHNHNNTNTSQDWKENYNSQNFLPNGSCDNQNVNNEQQQPKLENFLGGHSFGDNDHSAYGGNSVSSDYMFSNCSLQLPAQPEAISGGGGSSGGSNSIGLSMIKTWLRNQTPQPENNNNIDSGGKSVAPAPGPGVGSSAVQSLSLSMSTGSQSSGSVLQVCGESSTSDNKQSSTVVALDNTQTRKSIDTFGQRTSIYRGVTRHRWTGRYEAHLWDNSCRREGQTRKGRQVYLGGYDKEEKAARAYDLAALKYWGTTTTTNFPISHYEKEVEEMKHMTRQEYVASLRRKSSGFSRGASIYRGVTRHHQHGRWQARIGRVAGNKDLYLGTFSTQEEAAEAYDVAAIKFRGLSAVTNFDMSRYDVKSILESTTLPIGGAAKRLKDMEQVELSVAVDSHTSRITEEESMISSHTGHLMTHEGFNNNNYHAWHALSFQQPQPLNYQYGQRLWCKQEQDSDVHASHTHHHVFPDIQLGNNGNNYGVLNLDNSAYDNGNCYGGGGYMMNPMGDQRSNNGFGDNYDESVVFGSTSSVHHQDPYHGRNMYYYSSSSSSVDAVKATAYDQGSTWVPTAIPTLARPSF